MKQPGFTIVETLVVSVIIGILAVIVIPSYLKQVNRARETEALTTIRAMNQAQQAHYAEHGKLAYNTDELALGVKPSANYAYLIQTNRNDGLTVIANIARPLNGDLHGYVGGVALIYADGLPNTTSVLCQSASPGQIIGLSSVRVVPGSATTNGSMGCVDGGVAR